MPRGKRQVYSMQCTTEGCNRQLGTVRFHRQNSKGVTWKDNKMEKFCNNCRKIVPTRLKDVKHTSGK